MDEQIVLTPSAVVALLSQIEELTGASISIQETADGMLLEVNGNMYDVQGDTSIEVEDEIIDAIDDANEEGYAELEEEDVLVEGEPVEGGIIKELAKTLLVGGLVRLTKDAVMKS